MDPVVKLTQRVITCASAAFVAAAAVPAAVQTPTPVPEPPSADLMMRTIRRTTLLACALLIASCTGGSEVTEPVTPSATEVVATETPTVVAEPTATPTPEPIVVTEDDRIAAAMAAFEADPQPTELIAYDYLEPLVSTNQIRLTVCGWTGETVFDDVYQIAYRVGNTLNEDGEIDVAFESANTTLGTCTNTELIETALQATRDYDVYWTGVAAEPATFDEDQASRILTQEFIELIREIVAGWATEGLSFRNGFLDAAIPDSGVADPLIRSYTQNGFGVFEIITCRELPSGFGLYQGNVLIDDFTAGEPPGPHAIVQYYFTRRDGLWKILTAVDTLHVDCLGFSEGWVEGADQLFPDPTNWDRLP